MFIKGNMFWFIKALDNPYQIVFKRIFFASNVRDKAIKCIHTFINMLQAALLIKIVSKNLARYCFNVRNVWMEKLTWSIPFWSLWHSGFHDTRFCQIFWQIFIQGRAQKKIHQKLPLWGLNPQPLDHHSNILLRLGRRSVEQEISEVSFVSCTTSHIGLILETVEYDFKKALMIHTDNKIVT